MSSVNGAFAGTYKAEGLKFYPDINGLTKPTIEYTFVNVKCKGAGKVQIKIRKDNGQFFKCAFDGIHAHCANCQFKPKAVLDFYAQAKVLASKFAKNKQKVGG